MPSIVKMKYSLRPSLMICLGSAGLRLARAGAACRRRGLDRHRHGLRRGVPRAWPSSIAGDLADRDAGPAAAIFSTRLIVPDHQPHLGVLVLLARVVEHPDEALEAHLRLGRVGDADVVGRPADAAGEVRDLDRRLAVELALDVPVEHLRLVVREGRVEHLELVGVGQEPQLDRGRVDQRVGPGELERVDALLEAHLRVSRTSVRSSEL